MAPVSAHEEFGYPRRLVGSCWADLPVLMANSNLVRLLIDLSPKTDSHNHNEQHPVIDCVDNPIVANSESVPVAALEWTRSRGSRILREKSYCSLDPGLSREINFSKLSKCRRPKFNIVGAHDQPRSLFTCSQGMLSPTSTRAASNAATSLASSNASSIASY